MARSVRLDDLRTRVYRRADLVNATARFPSAEVTDELNESLAALYDRILAARGKEFYEKTSVITTTAGTAAYNLPSDFYQLISVEHSANGQNTPLHEYDREERGYLGSTSLGWSGEAFRFMIRGKTSYTASDIIEFLPIPATGSTVTVYYVPVAAKLSADADTFDGVDGWEEYAVLDCAAKLLFKNNKLDRVQVLEGMREAIGQRIDQLARHRNASGPPHVRDVRTRAVTWRRTS